MGKKLVYFSEKNIRGNHAGTKARNDAEQIFKDYGCKALNSKTYVLTSDAGENIHSNIRHRMDFLPLMFDVQKTKYKTVIVQYPMLAFDKADDFLKKISERNNLIFLVHDVHGLKRQNEQEINDEIRRLNLADGVILHNRFMEEKLLQCGLKVKKIYLLNLFDYLYQGSLQKDRLTDGVIFAGNLEKSDFFRSFATSNPDVRLNLFGPHFDEELESYPNIRYYGSIKPDILPGKLRGKYGLVWDGESIHTCDGIFGEYTRYNNPHKLSLYLASGFPVIVWREAAIAEYVEQHHVGLTLQSLEHLKNQLDQISDEQYRQMCQNVVQVRESLMAGNHLKNCLKMIEKDFS